MPRGRVNFQVQSAFIGPLATGFHFVSTGGLLMNNYIDLTTFSYGYNLIQQLDRIHNASYEIGTTPAALKQLGIKGLLSRPLIEPPSVALNFGYYINGIKNEARLGFDVNYSQFQSGHSGDSYYISRVCPISGFSSRELTRIRDNPFWSHTCKDFRNFFFVLGPEGQDIRKSATVSIGNEADKSYRLYDSGSINYEIISFGNCYINSYSLNASVGELPTANVSYVCENMSFQKNPALGGGIVPAVNKRDFQPTDKLFLIPQTVNEGGPSVLLPGDITLSITSGILSDFGANFNDAKCQNVSLDLPLPRENLNALGYFLPLDRPITPPVYATVKTDLIVGDGGFSGSVANLFTGSFPYNLTIKMLSRTDCNNPKFVAFQIDILKAVFRNASYSTSLTDNKTLALSWDVEVDTENLNQGIFWSGRHNIRDQNSLPTF